MSSGAMPRSWSRAMRASARSTKRRMYGSHSSGRCSPRAPESCAASSSSPALALTTATTRASDGAQLAARVAVAVQVRARREVHLAERTAG